MLYLFTYDIVKIIKENEKKEVVKMKIKYKGKSYKLTEKAKNKYLFLGLGMVLLITARLDFLWTLS